MPQQWNKPIDRRAFLRSAAGVGTVLAMPFAGIEAAKAGAIADGKRVVVVDTRFDDALRAASRLHADTHISMGLRPDAYRTWRESLRSTTYRHVCGVTTLSDYQLLRNCLEQSGYRLAQEDLLRGHATLVSWSLRQ
ncbi:MAG: hypothetical protein PVF50_06545 [Gammaproteobacteria bacterium]|jgi:hypothetical protein